MPDSYVANPQRSAELAQRQNEVYFPNMVSNISPTFDAPVIPIYIYNISTLELKDQRAPNHPHLWIKACPQGDAWVLAGSITHPFSQVEYDQNGIKRIDHVDGYREATVMLSPMNPGKDQNFTSPDPLNVGGNWNDYGVFWSINNPPTEQELAAARQRMERTYKAELAKMARIEAKNPQDALDIANDISHAAAAYYGESTGWHRSNLVPKTAGKTECGACGEAIQARARICIHCGAPTDPEKLEKWIDKQFREPGRPKSTEAA